MIDFNTIRALEAAFLAAKDHALAYRDAIVATADKYQLDPAALRQYISARAGLKVAALRARIETSNQLILQFEPEEAPHDESGEETPQIVISPDADDFAYEVAEELRARVKGKRGRSREQPAPPH